MSRAMGKESVSKLAPSYAVVLAGSVCCVTKQVETCLLLFVDVLMHDDELRGDFLARCA